MLLVFVVVFVFVRILCLSMHSESLSRACSTAVRFVLFYDGAVAAYVLHESKWFSCTFRLQWSTSRQQQ